jgi:hypothetical protein
MKGDCEREKVRDCCIISLPPVSGPATNQSKPGYLCLVELSELAKAGLLGFASLSSIKKIAF